MRVERPREKAEDTKKERKPSGSPLLLSDRGVRLLDTHKFQQCFGALFGFFVETHVA